MKYEWDTHKRNQNHLLHGIDFADVIEFDWLSALIFKDERKDYGEDRFNAFGRRMDGRVMCLTFTPRGEVVRVISYRKANAREVKRYEEKH